MERPSNSETHEASGDTAGAAGFEELAKMPSFEERQAMQQSENLLDAATEKYEYDDDIKEVLGEILPGICEHYAKYFSPAEILAAMSNTEIKRTRKVFPYYDLHPIRNEQGELDFEQTISIPEQADIQECKGSLIHEIGHMISGLNRKVTESPETGEVAVEAGFCIERYQPNAETKTYQNIGTISGFEEFMNVADEMAITEAEGLPQPAQDQASYPAFRAIIAEGTVAPETIAALQDIRLKNNPEKLQELFGDKAGEYYSTIETYTKERMPAISKIMALKKAGKLAEWKERMADLHEKLAMMEQERVRSRPE